MTELISLLDAAASSKFADTRAVLPYVLVDAAQNKALWQRLTRAFESQPLLIASADHLVPHLIAMPNPGNTDSAIQRAIRSAASADLTLLYSPLSLHELSEHLRSFLAVQLPGGVDMMLAFWDPAILGTLIGQRDDDTLHIRGPVFTSDQREAFLGPIAVWWYRDRENILHRIDGSMTGQANTMPLKLDQSQEDALVEAGVPDQILYHLETNRPTLFDADLPHHRRYRFVRAVLPSARQLGLSGMRDLTNFVAICLIYRQRMQTDPDILQLLDQVQKKELTFDEALANMPE